MDKIETSEKRQRKIAIVGGGITGLATAYALLKITRTGANPPSFVLLESASRLGGKIISEQVDGFLIEGGPDSFLKQKPWAVELARDLGLENEMIGTNPLSRKVFVANRGRLLPIPDGFSLITPTHFIPFVKSPLISWQGKLRMGMDLVIRPQKNEYDESIGHFVRRRFGQEALERIAEPLMAGIHVSDPEQQSLLATFPGLRTLERSYGSMIRAARAQQSAKKKAAVIVKGSQASSTWQNSTFVSLHSGMGQLVRALEKALAEEELLTRTSVNQVMPDQDGGYIITTIDGRKMRVAAVVLATPAYISAGLIRHFAPDLARKLESIRYVTSATASLAYWAPSLGKDLIAGSGFIVPRSENRKILAATINSYKFNNRAPQGYILVRCFLGGAGREFYAEGSPTEIIETVRGELAVLLGIQAKPIATRVYRWPKGNPQYDVGHLEKVKAIQESCLHFPGLFVTGSAYEGVGVPDCIHQGQQTAEKAIAFMNARERLAYKLAAGK